MQQQLPRHALRRLLARRLAIRPSSDRRPFTQNNKLTSTGRPQLPFLSVPLGRKQQFRYLTTERKRWLTYEVLLGFKYTIYVWAMASFAVIAYWSVQQEWLERLYPTPHEWGFLTRMRFRLAKWAPHRTDVLEVDWVQVGLYARNVLSRLEDPKIDGAGLQDLTEGGVWIDGIGNSGFDVTAKEEPWRRGYYEALMLCAKSAEHLDDQLLDKTRGLVFPANQVWGPSNPNPKPIPHGSERAPREEDCERPYDPPETYYMKILTTRGFSPRQKMDAALEYASWLDFKEIPEAAGRMYEWALSLGVEGTLLSQIPPYNPETYVLQDGPARPSSNLLTALTALATHKARYEDISTALPILISILRTRRALPNPSEGTNEAGFEKGSGSSSVSKSATPWSTENLMGIVQRFVSPPAYPPPPDDGESPPVRDAKELCEEATLNLYIGEIIYSGGPKSSSSSREDGLAWTREAVDLAEEQLHKLTSLSNSPATRGILLSDQAAAPRDQDAKLTCKECLGVGLENWAKMAARLAREEREKAETQQKASGGGNGSGWLSLWGRSPAEQQGRWAAEEKVVEERARRATEVLEQLEKPTGGFLQSFFKA